MQNTNPPLGPNRRELSSITSSTSISSRMSREPGRERNEYSPRELLSSLVVTNRYERTHLWGWEDALR
ncbi:hypothetical protein I79_004278 [Cricetulus griseus]|uniref:Uncharacterized protein n=1 Tax=Cricetulus griseus TaxID=10029 RepID=G3H2A7_CRIGR|nr:hypothetical protein I79_004278 [Cricetulus griseus]